VCSSDLFGRELYIEREDFMEEPPNKYHRLYPGNEVRLMNAYFVTCTGCVKDENGQVTEVHATYDPETKSGTGFTARKVKGTIHWVFAGTAIEAEVRLFENIIDEEKGLLNEEDGTLNLNPHSLTVHQSRLAAAFAGAKAHDRFQFLRHGYFCVDAKLSTADALVFNRIAPLKSSFTLPNK
jgi:glutaminyl-tRNA synthetase